MEILTNGIWVGDDAHKHHQFDSILAVGLVRVFKHNNIDNVVDLGCGLGQYTKILNDNDIKCIGTDGNPDTPQLTNGQCSVQNILTIDTVNQSDGVLCLEVAEHIPMEFEDIFITNILKYQPKLLIVSWALPGQGGDGHVNEKDSGYVIAKFNSQGYAFDYDTTVFLRANHVTNCWWFRNSLLVFRKYQ